MGYVRVMLGGDSWASIEAPEMEKAHYCGEATKLNQADSKYSLAVIKLLEIHQN